MTNHPPNLSPAPTVSSPRWLPAAGAALGACLGTIPPGLALLFAGFDRTWPDLRALLAELAVSLVMGGFGAMQLRAQILRRNRGLGVLFVLVNLALVGVMGVLIDFDLSHGSTDSGPAILIGLAIVAAVVVANALLAGMTWFLLAGLAKRIVWDLAQPEGEARTRVRAANWLVVVGGAHVLLKMLFTGPVVFGMVAAALACVLLLPVRRAAPARAPMVWGLAIVALGLVVSIGLVARDLRHLPGATSTQ